MKKGDMLYCIKDRFSHDGYFYNKSGSIYIIDIYNRYNTWITSDEKESISCCYYSLDSKSDRFIGDYFISMKELYLNLLGSLLTAQYILSEK